MFNNETFRHIHAKSIDLSSGNLFIYVYSFTIK